MCTHMTWIYDLWRRYMKIYAYVYIYIYMYNIIFAPALFSSVFRRIYYYIIFRFPPSLMYNILHLSHSYTYVYIYIEYSRVLFMYVHKIRLDLWSVSRGIYLSRIVSPTSHRNTITPPPATFAKGKIYADPTKNEAAVWLSFFLFFLRYTRKITSVPGLPGEPIFSHAIFFHFFFHFLLFISLAALR